MNLTNLILKVWAWYKADPVAASAQIVAALAILREILLRVEGYLVIWVPQTSDSKFWLFWAKLMATFDHASLSSPRKPHAIRALYEWKQNRARTLQRRQQIARAAVGASRRVEEPAPNEKEVV